MLPLPASVFIAQLIALLGIAALAQIVNSTAYYLKQIDVRLMFHENIFGHLAFYRNYNISKHIKRLVFSMSLVGLALSFLPTFLSLAGSINDTQHISYINIQDGLDTEFDLSPMLRERPDKAMLNNFYDPKQQVPANSTGILLENFIVSIHRDTAKNPSGVWYNAHPVHFSPEQQLARWKQDPRFPPALQIVNDQGVFLEQNSRKPTYYLSYHNKAKSEGSFTLGGCVDNDRLKTNVLTNLSGVIEDYQVRGVQSVNRTCYPMTDPSLWLVSAQDKIEYDEYSLLNNQDDIYYRPAFLSQQKTASFSMGVSMKSEDKRLKQNSMMIKKSVHITIFDYDLNKALTRQDNCMSASFTRNSVFNQDINSIACQLVAMARQNPTLPMLQATRRTFEANQMINSVYTYLKNENGHGIMIDLTLYSAYILSLRVDDYSLEGEQLIAYQKMETKNFNDTTDFEQLLQSINPFPDINTEYGLNTITDLALALAVSIFSSLDFDNFVKTTATVVPSVKASSTWIAITCLLAVAFIIITLAASFLTPKAYKTDLRTLLVHTLIAHEARETSLEDDSNLNHRKNISKTRAEPSIRAVKFERTEGELKMDGSPIILRTEIPLNERATSSTPVA